MNCPHCNAASDVLATRVIAPHVSKRYRECAAGHRFDTVEVPAERAAETVAGLSRHRRVSQAPEAVAQRRAEVLSSKLPDAALAEKLGVAVSTVRGIRSKAAR